MGSWGNGSEYAKNSFNIKGLAVPQLLGSFPNFIGEKLGANNARRYWGIHDSPNFPNLFATSRRSARAEAVGGRWRGWMGL